MRRTIAHIPILLTKAVVAVALCSAFAAAAADSLSFRVAGVDDPLLTNVKNQITTVQVGRQARLSEKDFASIIDKTIGRARIALRPYGYYRPEISGVIRSAGDGVWVLELDIDRGSPLLVDAVQVDVTGDGAQLRVLRDWQAGWPLGTGDILDQQVWELQKQRALDVAAAYGYLDAEFSEHRLDLDLESNRASLTLTLETGPRYVMGDIDFGEHVLKPGILEYVARFDKGDPYNRRLIDKFRVDLWKSGYFTNVDVEESKTADVSPPLVNLKVDLETAHRNSYQGSIGVGSDTGTRVQTQWSRHPMSSNGDRVDVGIGWQETDDEFSLRGAYRLPRRHRAREYWVSALQIRFENLDLEVKRRRRDENFLQVANGNVEERHLRAGRLKVRNFKGGEKQWFETVFVQYLNGAREFNPEAGVLPDLGSTAETSRFLKSTDNAISVGVDWDIASVRGKAFYTEGHRERAWVFHSNTSFGSDLSFSQLYLSTARSYVRANRWKLLLRAELGYTNASVDEFVLDVNGEPLQMSVTQLPNYYRFKTGGSSSVRGYGFEELSNNRVGSNHVITASAELEFKFLEHWSAAAFVDTGNAFNDWGDPDLKTGAGIGLRWYSIAGPIRVDVARALDLSGRPWRLHFTIGTPLL